MFLLDSYLFRMAHFPFFFSCTHMCTVTLFPSVYVFLSYFLSFLFSHSLLFFNQALTHLLSETLMAVIQREGTPSFCSSLRRFSQMLPNEGVVWHFTNVLKYLTLITSTYTPHTYSNFLLLMFRD